LFQFRNITTGCFLFDMPIVLFAALASALSFLDDRTFDRVLASRSRNEVWTILFDQGRNSTFATSFIQATQTIFHVLHFAIVDVSRFPGVAERSGVTKFPAVQFITHDDQITYTGTFSPKKIIQRATSLVPNFCLPVCESWRSDAIANPFAIFFTNKSAIPAVWRLLAAHYHGKSLRFGVSNDSDLLFPFGIREVPAIIASNGTISAFYKGKVKFAALTKWIDTFFAKRLFPVNASEILSPRRFRDACLGGKAPCVLVKAEGVSDKIEALRRAFVKRGFVWLVGVENLPYPFMKKGEGAWVYNPRKDGFAHAQTVDDLGQLLEAIENGQASWHKAHEINEL
jgi:hypothetical protein